MFYSLIKIHISVLSGHYWWFICSSVNGLKMILFSSVNYTNNYRILQFKTNC